MDNVSEALQRINSVASTYTNPLVIKTTKMFGDVLHGSIVVRHYKATQKRPIIWAISEKYVDVMKYYPYADKIIGLPHGLTLEERQVLRKQLPNAISPCVGVAGWNTAGSIADNFFFNAKIKKLAVPRRPVLPLGEEDYAWAKAFRKEHGLKRFMCMEYNSFSFERKVKGGIWPLEYYEEFLAEAKFPVVWLAHQDAPAFKNGIDGRQSSWRQAAALIKSATLFLGCGSGLTMVAASEGIDTPIMEVNIGSSITMKGCKYKNSFDLHKQTPKTLIQETSRKMGHLNQ